MADRPPLLDYGHDDPPEDFPRFPRTWKPVIVLLLLLAAVIISLVLAGLYSLRNGT